MENLLNACQFLSAIKVEVVIAPMLCDDDFTLLQRTYPMGKYEIGISNMEVDDVKISGGKIAGEHLAKHS